MNQYQPHSVTIRPLLAEIKFDESFNVCWAGQNPFDRGFCFGSEEGWLLYTDEEGKSPVPPSKGSFSEEAINGVARIGQCLAVSTRDAVNFWTLPEEVGGKIFCAVFPHGAHGVTATAGGSFIAPLGRTGIMTVKPPFDEMHAVTISGGKKEGLIFYRLLSLRSSIQEELVVCAAREAGVAATTFRWDQETHNLNTITFDGLDVVDVCRMGTNADSLAVAAVGRDGTLILFQNVLQEQAPIALKYDTIITGTAYRLLSCFGHLFLLTSDGLYMLAHLASRFMAKEPIGGKNTPILAIPMEGIDAAVANDRWLLVVMIDGVRRYDLVVIHDSIPKSISEGDIKEFAPRAMSPQWKHEGVSQHRTPMLAGAI